MATLSITNNYSLPSNGIDYTGKQGDVDDAFATPFDFTVDGKVHAIANELADGTARTIWDGDDDNPATFDYAWIVGDQDFYIQVIGTGTSVIFKVKAGIPWTISGFDEILAAASVTAMTGTEPTMTDIDSLVIQNNSGTTLTYSGIVIS